MKLGKMREGEEGKGREVTFLILLKTLAMVMISLMSESQKKKKKGSINIEVYRSSSHDLSLTDSK